MTTDIFIRTYHKDLEWLKYCLRSIAKFTTGFRQVIICIPENQVKLLEPFGLTMEKVITCPIYKNDYLGQQVSKMQAFKHTNADNIMFVDSDVHFTGPATPQTFMEEGKPIIYKTHYALVGDAICWKEPTEYFIGKEVKHEYMRTMPLMFRTETLSAINNAIPNLEARIMERTSFSEFNLMGAFAQLYEPQHYAFKNTEDSLPDYPSKQAWSHGGITPEIKKELNELLEVNY